ncbi:MAG: lytic transglycosylase domain-containing protein, partial [Aquificaceae bacterium]
MKGRELGAAFVLLFTFSCTTTVKQAIVPRSKDNIRLVQKGSFTFSEEEEEFVRYEARNFGIPVPDREEIKKYMLYYLQNKPYFEKTLQRASQYMPLIRPIIEGYGLPSELSFLPIIESAFNPSAVSRSGAAGLWQFIPSTARKYGLRVDSNVDERFDVVKSTEAAAKYLKDLYSMFGNWELALAAYNCGENCVLTKTAGVDFWVTKDMLPMETRNYVPAFFGVLLLAKGPYKYGINTDQININLVKAQTPEDAKQEYKRRERIITL